MVGLLDAQISHRRPSEQRIPKRTSSDEIGKLLNALQGRREFFVFRMSSHVANMVNK